MEYLEINEIEKAQQEWADLLTAIGEAYVQKRDYQSPARLLVEKMYGYREGPVLFKPTKAVENPFRLTEESALSYFVGGNPDYPEDKGFALCPWKSVRFENAGIIPGKDYALTMGNYYFFGMKGDVLKVEFTIGWFRTKEGRLKMNLHHSSVPYVRMRE